MFNFLKKRQEKGFIKLEINGVISAYGYIDVRIGNYLKKDLQKLLEKIQKMDSKYNTNIKEIIIEFKS